MSNTIPQDAYAIIIGAMKCGTSSLYKYLTQHPEICPAFTKEPEYFSENQGHKIQLNSYNDLWVYDHSVHKYVLEASTGYTKYPAEPNVAKKIYDYGISPKFIYIIRNPFDRIVSHYNYMQRNRLWHLRIDDRHLVNTSNYYLQLEQYRKYFPMRNILLLDFDELRDSPDQLLRRTYEFLGLASNYFPEEYEVHNPTHVVSKIEQSICISQLGAVLRYLPKPIKRVGKHLLRNVTPPAKRILTSAERETIYSKLKGSMSCLYHIYGFDAQKWGFDI